MTRGTLATIVGASRDGADFLLDVPNDPPHVGSKSVPRIQEEGQCKRPGWRRVQEGESEEDAAQALLKKRKQKKTKKSRRC